MFYCTHIVNYNLFEKLKLIIRVGRGICMGRECQLVGIPKAEVI